MKDTGGGRSEQQGETAPAMAADHDQVDALFLGDVVYLGLCPADHQVAVGFGDVERIADLRQVQACLLVDFFLDARKIHRDIATVGEAERLDDVNDTELATEGISHDDGAFDDLL